MSCPKATDEEIAAMAEIAGASSGPQAAVDAINSRFSTSRTYDSIDRLFRRRFGLGARKIIGAARPVEARPAPAPKKLEENLPPNLVPHPPAPPAEKAPDPSIEDLEEEARGREEVARYKRTIKNLVDELRSTRARHDFLDRVLSRKPTPLVYEREKASSVREVTAVALASDWHVEEDVRPASVAGRNEYDLEVADLRVRRFFHGVAWNVEHHRASGKIAIRDLVLWLGGDLITGYIHPELVENNSLSPSEAVLWLLPRLRGGLVYLLDMLGLERIVVPCSHGNHGRTGEKTRVASGYANSFEFLMYCALAEEFRDEPRVVFEITESNHQYVEVYGRTLHFHHGDEVRYQGGVGGLGIPLLKRVPQWDQVRRADVHNIGHWHQLLDFGRAVVNGSLVGYNSYAQSIGASFEPPQQALYYVDSRRGKCMGVTSIWVDDQK